MGESDDDRDLTYIAPHFLIYYVGDRQKRAIKVANHFKKHYTIRKYIFNCDEREEYKILFF